MTTYQLMEGRHVFGKISNLYLRTGITMVTAVDTQAS